MHGPARLPADHAAPGSGTPSTTPDRAAPWPRVSIVPAPDGAFAGLSVQPLETAFPAFRLEPAVPLPAGWLHVRLLVGVAGGGPVDLGLHDPGWCGEWPEVALGLTGGGLLERLVRLPHPADALHLCLYGTRGEGSLEAARLEPLTEAAAARWMLRRNPALVPRLARAWALGGALRARTLLSRHAAGLSGPALDPPPDRLTAAERWALRRRLPSLNGPLISILMPVHDPDPGQFRRALDTVRAQLYPRWELCIADDASTDPAVVRLLERAAAEDSRIRVVRRGVNGGIVAASNTALELAQGTFAALMDQDDAVPPHALALVAEALAQAPATDLLFTDEDRIDGRGRRSDPYRKPGWDPELLLAQNMVSHLGVYRTALLRRLGGFRPGVEGSQDHDLALRVAAVTGPDRVRHIPRVLYHWRVSPQSFSQSRRAETLAAGRRAVADHLAARGEVAARVLPGPGPFMRIVRPLPVPPPLVSLIVPGGGGRAGAAHLARCLEGLLRGTDYAALEILLPGPADGLSGGGLSASGDRAFLADPRLRILHPPPGTGPGRVLGLAVQAAQGTLLGFVPPDAQTLRPDWLALLAVHALRPGIGAAGPKLLDTAGRLLPGQGPADLVTGPPPARGADPPLAGEAAGDHARAVLPRAVPMLSAAGLLTRTSLFRNHGVIGALGQPDMPAFGRRLRQAGMRLVWAPEARLVRHDA